MKVKGWNKFQHYANRNPPWIKLHRKLLDERKFGNLPDSAAKFLIYFWLSASENGKDGELPPIEDMAFRLRTTEAKILKYASELSDFLDIEEQGESEVLAGRKRSGVSELSECSELSELSDTERDSDGLSKKYSPDFERFWKKYPRGEGKRAAFKAWKSTEKHRPSEDKLLSIVDMFSATSDWNREGGKYIPHASTWLNGHRWEDKPRDDSRDGETPQERARRESMERLKRKAMGGENGDTGNREQGCDDFSGGVRPDASNDRGAARVVGKAVVTGE